MEDGSSLSGNAGFRRLWSARVVTRFGSTLGYVALLWYVYAETGSAFALVFVGVAEFLTTVGFGLFSGALVDRYPRKRLIVLSTLARGGAMAGLVLALLVLGFDLAIVVFAAAVFSVCGTFFGPASQAMLPEIVPKASLDVANGLFQSTESVAGIAGSAAAGALVVAVGAVPSLGLDAACYVVGAFFVALVASTAGSRPTPSQRPSLWREVGEGLAYLRRQAGLLQLTLVFLLSNFLFSVVITFLVIYVSGPLRGTALVYGGLEAVLAAGWGAGGLLVGRLGLTRFTGRLAAWTGIVEGGVVLGLVLLPRTAAAFPLLLAAGLWQGILNVAWLSTVQAVVPQELQGRYLATDNALSYAAIPASQVLGGVLVTAAGLPITFTIVGIGSLAVSGLFLPLRSLRTLRYDPRSSTAAPEPGSA